MLEWEKIRKKIKKHEIYVVVISIICFLLGLGLDLLCELNISNFLNGDFKDFSLTILQIFATIATLTLSVIALLSGTITDSYMGISVSSYYLEKRPFLFKHKVVIVIEFILLISSIILHIFGLYNSVLMLFIISSLLIIISIIEVCEIFKGKMNTIEEIEGYSGYLFKNSDDFSAYGERFVEGWKEIVAEQSEEEFYKYYLHFIPLIERILSDEADVENLNSICSSMALFLLENENKNCKIKGIRFVKDVYYNIWMWISSNRDAARNKKDKIQLISRVDREWNFAKNSLDAESLEEVLDWDNFSELVIRVASWIGYSQEQQANETVSINAIAKTFGGYIEKQTKKGNLINDRKWGNIVRSELFLGAYDIPEEASDFYKEALAFRDFCVCYGYIFSGNLEYIKNAVFLDGISKVYHIDDWVQVYRLMLIHCFLYYLAYRESTDCINESLQNKIKELLNDKKVISSVSHFYECVIKKIDVLSSDLENKLERILIQYEPFPEHSDFKTIKIDKAVKEYFLYVLLMCARYSYDNNILYDVLDVDKYLSYLMSSNNNILKNRLEELHTIFVVDDEDKIHREKRSKEMLSTFEQMGAKKYKDKLIEDASQKQRKYEINEIQSKAEEHIRDIVIKQYKSFFNELSYSFRNVKQYRNIQVFNILIYTDMLMEGAERYYLEYVIGKISDWIMNRLIFDFGVKKIDREKAFSSDEELRGFIQKNHFDTLLGAQNIFDSYDYEDYRIHTDFITERNCIFIPMANAGIAMRGKVFGVNLEDVSVDIFSPTIDEITDIKKDDKSGKYMYEISSKFPIEFEEKEIREYIHDDRKLIKISINASIYFNDKEKEHCVIIL